MWDPSARRIRGKGGGRRGRWRGDRGRSRTSWGEKSQTCLFHKELAHDAACKVISLASFFRVERLFAPSLILAQTPAQSQNQEFISCTCGGSGESFSHKLWGAATPYPPPPPQSLPRPPSSWCSAADRVTCSPNNRSAALSLRAYPSCRAYCMLSYYAWAPLQLGPPTAWPTAERPRTLSRFNCSRSAPS